MAEAMYRQIADDLRHKIRDGEIAQGSQLPTELDLQKRYNASRNTVRDAIKWLTTRGLVETRPGQGTFVTEPIIPFLTTLTGDPGRGGGEEEVYRAEVEAARRKPAMGKPTVEIQEATTPRARALGVRAGTHLVSRHQECFIDGTPWSLQTSFYPLSLVLERGATRLMEPEDIPEGAVAYLASRCGIKQAGYRDRIRVRAPDETETAFFRLPADGRIAVFVIDRVGYTGSDEPFRLTVTVYPSDRNQLLINVGAVPPPRLDDGPPAASGAPGAGPGAPPKPA